jgi:hypothetical protein
VIVKRLGISSLTAAGLLEGDPAALPEFAELKAVIVADHGDDTPAARPSSIEDWVETIEAMLEAGAGPTAIYDRLRLGERFEGSLGAVKRLCLRLRKGKGRRGRRRAIPVDTVAGEVAQVDFGYVGQLYDPDEGRMRKAWIFVMVLAFSRLMVVRIAFDQKIETWLRCHAEAILATGVAQREDPHAKFTRNQGATTVTDSRTLITSNTRNSPVGATFAAIRYGPDPSPALLHEYHQPYHQLHTRHPRHRTPTFPWASILSLVWKIMV